MADGSVNGRIVGTNGVGIAGVSVAVYVANTNFLQNIKDEDGNFTTNPLTTDSTGAYFYQAESGTYDERCFIDGEYLTSQRRQIIEC